MFCVGAGGSKALGLTMNLLPPGPEHIEKPSNSKTVESNGVERGGSCTVYFPDEKIPPPSVANQLGDGRPAGCVSFT